MPFVKDDGILCGDDYASGWPGIVRVVNALGASRGVRPWVAGRCWVLLKEGGAKTDITSVAPKDRSLLRR